MHCQSLALALWQLPQSRKLARESLLHPFVQSLGSGSLSADSFQTFMKQDAFFLDAFSRAFAAGASCARTAGLPNIEQLFLKQQDGVAEELKLHNDTVGNAIEHVIPLSATDAYISFLLKLAEQTRDMQTTTASWHALARLCAGLAPCMRLYAWIGAALAGAGCALDNMPENLQKWIAEYSSDEFQTTAGEHDNLLDACWAGVSADLDDAGKAAVMDELRNVYCQALTHELGFFAQQDSTLAGVKEGTARRLLHSARLIPPRVLIIAGSDSGGGAGIQADLKACTALGVFGTTAIAALTAQNTHGVQGIFPVPVPFVRQQIRSVMDDIGADVIKTGMLATAELVRGIAQELHGAREQLQFVLDPVMVSSSGHVLLESDAVQTFIQEVFPLATILTPNLHEAKLLLDGRAIASVSDMEQAAQDLCEMGPEWVLVKGGHLDSEDFATDILCCGRSKQCERLSSPMVHTTHTHGTGCTLASSIAALLASGFSVPDAVKMAKRYLTGAIEASAHLALGSGPQGPLNHCWQTAQW